MVKKPQKEVRDIPLNFRVDAATKAAIEALAEGERRSVSGMLIELIHRAAAEADAKRRG